MCAWTDLSNDPAILGRRELLFTSAALCHVECDSSINCISLTTICTNRMHDDRCRRRLGIWPHLRRHLVLIALVFTEFTGYNCRRRAQPASVSCSRRGAEVEQAHASPITSLHRTVSPDRISHNCVTVGGSPLAYVRLYPPLSKLFGCMGVAWD